MGSGGGRNDSVERALDRMMKQNESIMQSNREDMQRLFEQNRIMNDHWRQTYETMASNQADSLDKKIEEAERQSDKLGDPSGAGKNANSDPSDPSNPSGNIDPDPFNFTDIKKAKRKSKANVDHSTLFRKA